MLKIGIICVFFVIARSFFFFVAKAPCRMLNLRKCTCLGVNSSGLDPKSSQDSQLH